MTTLRNKRKLAAIAKDSPDWLSRNSQSQNSTVLRVNEEYITEVSEEMEGRVTKKLSREFSRIESRILGALSKLDEFLQNLQVRVQSQTVARRSRNMNVDNEEPRGDRSKNDPRPRVDASIYQTTQPMDSDPEETPYNNEQPIWTKSGIMLWKDLEKKFCLQKWITFRTSYSLNYIAVWLSDHLPTRTTKRFP